MPIAQMLERRGKGDAGWQGASAFGSLGLVPGILVICGSIVVVVIAGIIWYKRRHPKPGYNY